MLGLSLISGVSTLHFYVKQEKLEFWGWCRPIVFKQYFKSLSIIRLIICDLLPQNERKVARLHIEI